MRLALGARGRHIVAHVIGEAGRLVVVGAAIGILASVAAARSVGSLLFGVTATDPWVLAGACALLAAIAADRKLLSGAPGHERESNCCIEVRMTGFLHDLRYALRGLVKSPGFTAIALVTLALGIGANTAIFSIVNGVILRPLGYPAPERLMFLTTQFPSLGFTEFWVSPPEYFEFRELNRSFSAVGAFTTGEVNVMASDRPVRVRSASVDDHLLNALNVQPAQGRLFAKGEADVTGPPPMPGQPAPQPARVVILSHELWQSALGGRPMLGQTVEVNGVNREVIGIMPPGTDVMDNRTAIWMPLGLNPGNRQNRGSHFSIGRLKEWVAATVREPS